MSNNQLSVEQVEQFRQKIWDYYRLNKRDFIWRNEITPYRILVSEIMLQQTQTARVMPKFERWMDAFPDIVTLAQATTAQVLSCWQGLGYNRRGLALHNAAKEIVQNHQAVVPHDPALLVLLSGIGVNTAGSITAFAYDKPVVFIETNIRTIFLHEFFKDEKNVSDKMLLPLIEQTLPSSNIRDWYYALMDYGVYLKQIHKADNKTSKHYARQSKFVGSFRQVRGAVVRLLTSCKNPVNYDFIVDMIQQELPHNQHDVSKVLQTLVEQKIVQIGDDQYWL